MKKSLAFTTLLFTTTSFAGGVDFNNQYICNNYTRKEGVITEIMAATTYDGNEYTYVNILSNGTKFGGYLYPRSPYETGYNAMVKIASAGMMTGKKVTLCASNNIGGARTAIYAIKITQ